MHRHLWLVTFASLITAVPALAQESNQPSTPSNDPFTPSGEIQIPSGASLDRMEDQIQDNNAVAPPDEELSPTDPSDKALQQQDQRDERIDREVIKGID
jgi:hypothetical protein